jgi:hypothetical protein
VGSYTIALVEAYMREDEQELAMKLLEHRLNRAWGSCGGGAGRIEVLCYCARTLRAYCRRLRKCHVRNGFALEKPCCWPHGLRVGRDLRVGGVDVIDRGYRYARSSTRPNLRFETRGLPQLFLWLCHDHLAGTVEEQSSVTIMQLYRVSI